MSGSSHDVAVASDHAGTNLKRAVVEFLEGAGKRVADLGPEGLESVDYPQYARRVCRAVLAKEASWGILICGSGLGMSMAANRHVGIRAARVCEPYSARMAREHNDANVLVLGERITGVDLALECVSAFLESSFVPGDDGRHARRVEMIDQGL